MLRVIIPIVMAFTLTACVVVPIPVGGTEVSRNNAIQFAAVPVSGFGAMLNKARADNGLGALSPNTRLAAAAQSHAQDMVQRGYFAHQSINGTTPATRVRANGYCYRFVAENLASGQYNEASVIAAWMGSPGHRQNMLARNAREYGLGRQGNMWVLVLGTPC